MVRRAKASLSVLGVVLVGIAVAIAWGLRPVGRPAGAVGVPGDERAGSEPTTPTLRSLLHRTLLPDEEPAAEPHAGAGLATIRGTVVDDASQGARDVTIRLLGTDRTAVTDTSGRFSFEVRAGTYQPVVVEESLAIGVYPAAPNGSNAASVRIAAGEEADVTLRLFHKAKVRGRVRSRDGEVIPAADIRLQSTAAAQQSLAYDAKTDAAGRFEMDVRTGPYRVQLWLVDAEERFRSLGRPVPRDVEIPIGITVLDDVVLGAGMGVVKGRVVNQDGQPFPGLPVRCYPKVPVGPGTDPHRLTSELACDVTDESGAFTLEGLPEVRVAVAVAPYAFLPFRQLHGGELNRLAAHVEQVVLDLSPTSGAVDLGAINAVENRPYTLRGEVQLGPRSEALGLRRIKAMLAVGESATLDHTLELPLAVDGSFAWTFDAPTSDTLHIWLAVDGIIVQRTPLFPVPGGQRYQSFALP